MEVYRQMPHHFFDRVNSRWLEQQFPDVNVCVVVNGLDEGKPDFHESENDTLYIFINVTYRELESTPDLNQYLYKRIAAYLQGNF